MKYVAGALRVASYAVLSVIVVWLISEGVTLFIVLITR